jgi:hypothetical protein
VLGAIAIIPSAPVLVPELVGAAAAEVADLRAAAIGAAAALPPRWVAVGAGTSTEGFGAQSRGTFAGFGVDVPVRLSAPAQHPAELPLYALIAGWVRGRAQPDARVDARGYGHDLDDAPAHGRQLRTEIDAAADPIGVLVVADGANTLTAAAPGGYHPGDIAVQRGLDDALAGGDAAALIRLPGQIVGRTAFAVLAGLAEPGPRSATELYRGAPYGVGYFAGVWQP